MIKNLQYKAKAKGKEELLMVQLATSVSVSYKMDYLIAYFCLLLIFVHQIVGVTEIYRENELWMFYVNNDTNVSRNSTQQGRYQSINTNLSVSYQPMTRNFHRDIETFCEILTKTKVVAFLLPPNFEGRIEFTLAAKHLAIPVLTVPKSSKDTQEYLHINLYPRPTDSLPQIMEILRTWTPAAVLCNTKTYEGMKYLTTSAFRDDIKFYHLTFGLSSAKRIHAVAEILAKIRNLKVNNLVIYVAQEDLREVITLGEMMQMTGSKYKWILTWENKPSNISLPVNTLILQPKNSTEFKNILSDAADLIKQAFGSYTNKYTKDRVPYASCFDIVDPSFGEEFHRHIIQQSFVGKTGYFAFDEQGSRINAEYEVVDLKNKFVRETPPSHSRIPKKIRAVTALSAPFVYLNQMVNIKHSCGTGLICHVYAQEGNHTTQFCCEGYIIDIVHLLQTDLGVDIEVHITKDGKHGSLDEKTNQWNGMIGEIIRCEADIAIADLTITDDRSRVVDFTHPFMEIGVGVLVRVDRQSITQGIWAFLQPVAAQLWIATFLAISLMGILFWAMERIAFWIMDKFATHKEGEKHEIRRQTLVQFTFAASLHYSWSTVVRTRDKVIRPSNNAAKIGAISLALCFLVFITTYTAQLAAFLVAELHVTPITRGIQDGKLQHPGNDLKIATISGSSIERFFRTSPDPKFTNIWKHMMGNNVPTCEIGVERLKANQIDVLIGDYNTMVYIAAQDPNCSLRVIGEPFFRSGYGIALQKNSTWTSIFSQKLLQYEKFDTFLELAHRWMKTSCGNEENGNSVNFNTFHRMTAYDVSGMFVVLGVAVGLCWIMLAAEFYYKRLKRRHRDDQ